ncbi:hypothetical protein J5N97_009125 [Dioscorea zingiberensis]|uniref:Cysteine proteinase inhibitor n=1 Tax=Dioscorea zingiberensis TaxID=325984 RepID=A0A9D5CVT1_9LILI|nr:hypothetical protein J5N97_009125 [Dioscorea zingiberensis]
MASSTQEIKGMEINENIYNFIDFLAGYVVQVHNQQQTEVEGVLYYITLIASNIGVEQLYEAKVWVKESTGYIELQDIQHVVDITDVETNKEKAHSKLVYIAKFAVKEYNNKKNADLVFVKVMDIDGRSEPVLDGKFYYITFEASSFGVVRSYEAMVWAKASSGSWPWLELVDFKTLILSTPAS